MAIRPFRPAEVKENIVPKTTDTVQLGTDSKYWLAAFITTLTVAVLAVSGQFTALGGINTTNISSLYNLSLFAGGSEIMRLTNTGNVGIGTTNPGVVLVLQSSGATTNYLRFQNTSGTGKSDIGIAGATDNGITGALTGDLNIKAISQKILFSVDDGTTANMVISTAGNVGIGTTNPIASLQVGTGGDAAIKYVLVDGLRLSGDDTSNTIWQSITNSNLLITISGASASTNYVGLGDSITGASLVVRRDGNVGIGTTTPNSTVHIITSKYTTDINFSKMGLIIDFGGTGYTTPAKLSFGLFSDTDEPFIQSAFNSTVNRTLLINPFGGEVGIGTSSPNATLSVGVGCTTIADAWTVRSDESIKTSITKIDDSLANFNAATYRYKLKETKPNYEYLPNSTIKYLKGYSTTTSRERVGLIRSEVPEICQEGQGIDLYCIVALQHAKLIQLESRIKALGG